jgi:hypothetical protein
LAAITPPCITSLNNTKNLNNLIVLIIYAEFYCGKEFESKADCILFKSATGFEPPVRHKRKQSTLRYKAISTVLLRRSQLICGEASQ